MQTIWLDLKYGSRMLRSAPAFTAVAVLSLAFGIGANTAIFSVMDAFLLKMLPVQDPEQLVWFRTPVSYPSHLKLRDRSQKFMGICATGGLGATVRYTGEAERGTAQMVCGGFYSMLGIHAAIGRVLTADDDKIPGVGGPQGPVAVLSYQYWQRRFNLDTLDRRQDGLSQWYSAHDRRRFGAAVYGRKCRILP